MKSVEFFSGKGSFVESQIEVGDAFQEWELAHKRRSLMVLVCPTRSWVVHLGQVGGAK